MAYSAYTTVNAGDPVTADRANQDKANVEYLLSGRAGVSILYDNGGNYTTTSDTFTPVDNTNITITMTLVGSKLRFGFSCRMYDTNATDFDVTLDGTRIGNAFTNGLASMSAAQTVSYEGLVTGQSAGAHTLVLVWKRHSAGAGTPALCSGGAAGSDFPVTFWAQEVG